MSHVEPGLLLILLLGAAGFAPWMRRLTRGRNVLTPVAVALLVIWSSEPAARVLAWTIEARYPAALLPAGDAQAIVVLSGGLESATGTQPFTYAEPSTYRRTRFASWLYKNWKPLPLLVSGGPIGLPPEYARASAVMDEILRKEGIPEEHIWQENRSLNTYQNAVNSVEMLRRRGIRRIALVTDSRHMLRAELCFRKLGVEVVAAPCCSISGDPVRSWLDWFPSSRGIDDNEATLHEWLGLIWYRLKGRI